VLNTIRQHTSQIEATRLQIQTVQVDSENLRRQISVLRAREPTLGLTGLKERRQQLEEENRVMHVHVAENQRLREVLTKKEAELSAKRLAEGLPEERPRPGTARPRSSCGPASASDAAEAVLELSGRLQNEAGSFSSSRASGTGSRVIRQETTAADLRFRNHLLRRELERTKERMNQCRADACTAILGQELVGAIGVREASEASERLPRRPCTAAPNAGRAMLRKPAEDSTDLDALLQRNEENLQQFTGRLRETEVAMGLQRPMTTGHIQRPRLENRAVSDDPILE